MPGPIHQLLLWVVLLNPPGDAETLKLIKKTGDASFKVREKATLKLKDRVLGPKGWWIVAQLEYDARHNPDAEIRARCKWVVAHFYLIGPSNGKKMPWLCYTDKRQTPYNLQGDHQKYLEAATKNYGGYSGSPQDGYLPWRCATELLCHDLLRLGFSRERVIALLDRMVLEEEAYEKANDRRP